MAALRVAALILAAAAAARAAVCARDVSLLQTASRAQSKANVSKPAQVEAANVTLHVASHAALSQVVAKDKDQLIMTVAVPLIFTAMSLKSMGDDAIRASTEWQEGQASAERLQGKSAKDVEGEVKRYQLSVDDALQELSDQEKEEANTMAAFARELAMTAPDLQCEGRTPLADVQPIIASSWQRLYHGQEQVQWLSNCARKLSRGENKRCKKGGMNLGNKCPLRMQREAYFLFQRDRKALEEFADYVDSDVLKKTTLFNRLTGVFHNIQSAYGAQAAARELVANYHVVGQAGQGSFVGSAMALVEQGSSALSSAVLQGGWRDKFTQIKDLLDGAESVGAGAYAARGLANTMNLATLGATFMTLYADRQKGNSLKAAVEKMSDADKQNLVSSLAEAQRLSQQTQEIDKDLARVEVALDKAEVEALTSVADETGDEADGFDEE